MTDSVDWAQASAPANDSERLVFRQLYQTLVRIDCRGKIRPAIAESWKADSEATVWTLTLREDGRFPGGTLIKAPHVAILLSGPEGRAAGIDSAVPLDDRRVRIRLHDARDTLPVMLAEPGLAMLDGMASVGPISRFDIPARDGRPVIEFLVAPHGDPRDAIDRGVDLVVTRDPSVAEYVANRPEFVTYPLPWSRTYTLLQPAGAIWILGLDSMSHSLARDVAQSEARAAEPPYWWRGQCPYIDLGYVVAPPISPRIVYSRDDRVAQGLAERIVALARDTVQLRAAGLSPAEFATALRNQRDRGYVLGLPHQVLAPCHELAGLPKGARIEPLIDTRARAIVRRGSPPLSVDWDGTVTVVGEEDSSRALP